MRTIIHMGSVLFCSVDMRCLETVGRHIIEKSLFYIYLYLRLSVCVCAPHVWEISICVCACVPGKDRAWFVGDGKKTGKSIKCTPSRTGEVEALLWGTKWGRSSLRFWSCGRRFILTRWAQNLSQSGTARSLARSRARARACTWTSQSGRLNLSGVGAENLRDTEALPLTTKGDLILKIKPVV